MTIGAPALASPITSPEVEVVPKPAVFVVKDTGTDAMPRKVRKLELVPAPVRMAAPDAPVRARLGAFQPNTHLRVCFRRLSNAPATDNTLFVKHYYPLVIAGGKVPLAAAPVNDACMSSGFGPRFGRIHKGVDFGGRKHDPVFSAASGLVREAGWGRGYGKYVVLDHGHGVFTRYAHLNTIEKDVKPGTVLGFGQPLGTMGNTGNSTGVHLHYEVLTGEWGPRKAFGLEAHNPLHLPAYTPARADAVLTIDVGLTANIAK